MNRTINFFLVIVVMLIGLLSYAQRPAGSAEPSLWLRQEILFKEKKVDTSNYFNFNPKFHQTATLRNYSNLLVPRYSLFIVFKSEEKEEMDLANLQSGNQIAKISNKQVQGNKNLEYKKVNSRDGIVLSYFVSTKINDSRGTNKITFQNIKNKMNASRGHDLMELLFYPKVLNPLERQKVETYLSIKYGISRLGNVDYIDSAKNKIWNSKDNKNYSNRITGIGSDKSSGLLQKQSGNAEKDGLYIGYRKIDSTNLLNTSTLPDKLFHVWGDNGASTYFSGNSQQCIKKMKRIWKLQQTGTPVDSILTEVRVNKKEMQMNTDGKEKRHDGEMTWLVVSPDGSSNMEYTKASFYRPSSETKEIISFKDIIWDVDKSGSDLFTFIKAPIFFIASDVENPNCSLSDSGKITIKANGGTAPFRVSLQSDTYSKNIVAKEERIELSNIPVGKYKVTVTDNNNKSHSLSVEIETISDNDFSIASQWYLDEDGKVDLQPIISNSADFECKWYLAGRLISRNHTISATEAGDYILIVTNSKGCTKEFKLNVKSQIETSLESWKLYPNPIMAYQNFTLQFNLNEHSDVEISIYDANGRLVQSKNFYSIKDMEYRNSVRSAGTYLIVVKINGKTHALKLIVQ